MTRVNVERWREHVAALRKSEMTVAQYAQEHGLSRHTLYVARRQVERAKQGARKGKPAGGAVVPQSRPFVAVRVVSSPIALRACLPNGAALEFGQMEPGICAQLIGMISGGFSSTLLSMLEGKEATDSHQREHGPGDAPAGHESHLPGRDRRPE